MLEKYRNALAEVDEILDMYNDESISKIPSSFRNFIKQNKSIDYKVNIDSSLSLKEQNILHETKVFLAVIYRDFLANDEERKEFIASKRNKEIKIEEEKRKKYNPSKIFKNDEGETYKTLEITEIKKKNSFRKIIEKIKEFFKK